MSSVLYNAASNTYTTISQEAPMAISAPVILPSVLGPSASAGAPSLSDVLQTQVPGYAANNPLVLGPPPSTTWSQVFAPLQPISAAPGGAPVSWWQQASPISDTINNATMVGIGVAILSLLAIITGSARRKR